MPKFDKIQPFHVHLFRHFTDLEQKFLNAQHNINQQLTKNKPFFKQKYFVSIKNVCTFAPAFERKNEGNRRSGSSVWLEYMPVTHGVASSSLVRTAKQEKKFSSQRTFFSPQRH